MNTARAKLSIDIVDRMIDVWMADNSLASHRMDVLEYYNWLGWDISINYEGACYKSMSAEQLEFTVAPRYRQYIHTIAENQLAFFLLSL